MSTMNQSSLAHTIVSDLGQQLVRGDRQPGDSFPTEQQLCEEFNVSRSVVREAIKVLRSKGLIDSRPKRGISILTPDRWNLWDPEVLQWFEKDEKFFEKLAELRLSVEPAAASLAASHATKDQIRKIIEAASAMESAEEKNQPARFNQADESFHQEIADGSGNMFMRHLVRLINPLISLNRERTIYRLKQMESPVPLHKELAEAIRKRQPRKSNDLMKAIIEQAKNFALSQ